MEEMGTLLSKISVPEKALELEELRAAISRLLIIGPSNAAESEAQLLDTTTIKDNIISVTKEIREEISKQNNKITESLAEHLKILEDIKRDATIW